MKNNKSLTDYVFCNKCETNPCECEKEWMIEFDKKFVTPITTKMRSLNLNSEPCVMGTAKSVKQFISSLLEQEREINEDNIKNIINKYDKRINKSSN